MDSVFINFVFKLIQELYQKDSILYQIYIFREGTSRGFEVKINIFVSLPI